MGVLKYTTLLVMVVMVTLAAGEKEGTAAAVSRQELRDLLMESVRNTISLTALAEQQTQKMEKVMNSLELSEKTIQQMKEKLAASEEKLAASEKKFAEKVEMLNEEQGEIQASLEMIGGKIKELEGKGTDLSSNLQNLTQKVETVETATEKIGGQVVELESAETDLSSNIQNLETKVESVEKTWSAGSYCIMANGTCPAGFTRFEGFVKALTNYQTRSTYLKEAHFGSSFIGCYGQCGNHNPWNANIIIVACCK